MCAEFQRGSQFRKYRKNHRAFSGKKKDDAHNRRVVTVAGEPEPLKKAVIEAMRRAIDIIDMRTLRGQHPRMGARMPLVAYNVNLGSSDVGIADEIAKGEFFLKSSIRNSHLGVKPLKILFEKLG